MYSELSSGLGMIVEVITASELRRLFIFNVAYTYLNVCPSPAGPYHYKNNSGHF